MLSPSRTLHQVRAVECIQASLQVVLVHRPSKLMLTTRKHPALRLFNAHKHAMQC